MEDGRGGPALGCFAQAVVAADVFTHVLAVGCFVATLYTGVAPSGVLPENTPAAAQT